jgi:MFS transporter, NRE family, putaive nickel resistance protein
MSTLTRNAAFRKLFGAQAISLAGSGVTTVALALFVHQIAGAAAAAAVLGQALMLRIIAFLVFSQPAGVLADRMSRKPILIASDLARFGLIAFFPFITAVWQVYVAVFAVNCLTAFFTPAYEASLPEVVGEHDYVKALSYSRVAVDVEAIAGPALAGLLLLMMSLRWVFWFDAFTYLVSAALVMGVKLPRRTAPARSTAAAPGAFWHEITYGTRILIANSAIRQALVLSLAEAIAGACAIVVTVVYVRDVLGGTEGQFSLIMACVGIGSAVTAVFLSRLTRRVEEGSSNPESVHASRHRWAALSLLVGGVILSISVLPGILNPPLAVFGFLWILNGAGQALVAIPSSTLVAVHTSNDQRGRAFAAHFAITHACWLIAYPMTGHLASSAGPQRTFTLCGAACAVITATAWWMGRYTTDTGPHPVMSGEVIG